MCVRGSICAKVFMVGAGAPGGVSAPCPKAESARSEDEMMAAMRVEELSFMVGND